MAKFETRSIYTFTDELTGEEVEQTEEPTTFKIKLVGDSTTYEKIMSKENEAHFTDWLQHDGAELVGRYRDKIDALNREIAELVAENERLDAANKSAKSTATGRKPREAKPGSYQAVIEKHLGKTGFNDVKQVARDAGLTVSDRGAPNAEAWKAYAEAKLNEKQLSEVTQ